MYDLFDRNGFSLRESRLIHQRESTFGEHMKDVWEYAKGTYVEGNKGALDTAMSAVAGSVFAVLKAPDHLYKAAIGQKFNQPSGIMGHTVADTKSLIKNLFTLHSLRAAGDAWSIATADVWVDGANLIAGKYGGTKHPIRTASAARPVRTASAAVSRDQVA